MALFRGGGGHGESEREQVATECKPPSRGTDGGVASAAPSVAKGRGGMEGGSLGSTMLATLLHGGAGGAVRYPGAAAASPDTHLSCSPWRRIKGKANHVAAATPLLMKTNSGRCSRG